MIGSIVDAWAAPFGMPMRGRPSGVFLLEGMVLIPPPIIGTLTDAAVGAIGIEYLRMSEYGQG